MPLTWVLVRAPSGQAPQQNVFLNNDIQHPVGVTGTPFQVEAGVHTFSLRGGGRLIAEALEECPAASESAPFRIELIATASAVLDPPAPPRVIPTPPRRKKTARKKKAVKKPAPKRKAAAKRKAAPKRKSAAKRKTAPKRKSAPKRKAAVKRKTAGRKKTAKKAAAKTKTKTKRPARGRTRRK